MLRKRWVRRIGISLVVAIVLAVAGFFYDRHATRREGTDRLAAMVAHLDATDPRWRHDDIDADRGWLNDDQNSTLLVPQFKAALAGKHFLPVTTGPTREDVFTGIPPNHVLDDEGAAAVDAALEGKDAALAVACSFKDFPRGLRRYNVTPYVIDILLPDLQETRSICAMLDAEAEHLLRDGRPGAALRVVVAMLHTARSVDGEPFLMSCRMRLAWDAMVTRRVERVLGLATPKNGLAELQSLLAAEAEADPFWAGVRSERALMNVFFTNLRNGRVSPSIYSAMAGKQPSSTQSVKDHIAEWFHEPYLPGDQATYLESVTRVIELRSLPEHQRRSALKGIPVPAESRAMFFTNLLLPNLETLHDRSLRGRAQLRCAVAGVAVERFRQRNGRWPDSLTEIPKEILPGLPLDPFDGKPLKYARRANGVTVYSVGPDEQDNGGNVAAGQQSVPGVDLGFRLYDPADRGLPPVARPAVPAILPEETGKDID